MYCYNDFFGIETKSKEFKEFTFNNGGIILDIKIAENFCSNNVFNFNIYVIKNIIKYFEYFLLKCICSFINSNINGNFYIGINDFGFIKGIPYKGELPINKIKTKMYQLIKHYIISDNKKVNINKLVKFNIIKIKEPNKPTTNIHPNYISYLLEKEEYLIHYNKYLDDIHNWRKEHIFINQKLVDLINNSDSRKLIIEYIISIDANNIIIKLLKTNYKLEYKSYTNLHKLKLNPDNPYYWVTRWKDHNNSLLKNRKPIFNFEYSVRYTPINLIISIKDMIPYWFHNNDNMNLYLIHIEILKDDSIKSCKYYNITNKKWISSYRMLTSAGQPCCSRIL